MTLYKGRRRRSLDVYGVPADEAQVRCREGCEGTCGAAPPNGGWLSVRLARPRHSFIPKTRWRVWGRVAQGANGRMSGWTPTTARLLLTATGQRMVFFCSG